MLDDIPDASLEAELKQGVVFEYLQGDFDRIPHFSQLVPNATGTTTAISVDGESELALFQREPNFRPDDTQGLGDFACRFSGFLRIPMDGTWTFFLCSNDGSRLYIDGKAIVDNDGLHYSTEKQGRATLKTGVHAITVSYFHRNGKLMEGIRVGPQLSLSWYLPGTFSILGGGARGVPREVIPDEYLLFNPLGTFSRPPIRRRIVLTCFVPDAHTQHLLATGGDPAHEPPIPPSVAKRIKILENALEEQDSRLESMRLAFERIRGIQIFDDIRKAKPAEDREDAYTIRDTVGGDTVDGRGNEIEEQMNVNVGGPRELEDIIDAHVEEIEKLKEVGLALFRSRLGITDAWFGWGSCTFSTWRCKSRFVHMRHTRSVLRERAKNKQRERSRRQSRCKMSGRKSMNKASLWIGGQSTWRPSLG